MLSLRTQCDLGARPLAFARRGHMRDAGERSRASPKHSSNQLLHIAGTQTSPLRSRPHIDRLNTQARSGALPARTQTSPLRNALSLKTLRDRHLYHQMLYSMTGQKHVPSIRSSDHDVCISTSEELDEGTTFRHQTTFHQTSQIDERVNRSPDPGSSGNNNFLNGF